MISISPGVKALPDFPWDLLHDATEKAQQHPDGVIFLSTGTPVDPVPDFVQAALLSKASQPGYPTVLGQQQLRPTALQALWRRYRIGTDGPFSNEHILPVLGTKEFIASVVKDLGFNEQHNIIIPQLAYPTYEISAVLAGCSYVRVDLTTTDVTTMEQLPHADVIFVNSPANPTGHMLTSEQLRILVQYARNNDAILVSDECYLGLAWEGEPVSVLNPRVTDGDISGILCVHSLSKISNMASYRSGFIIGDPMLIAILSALRRHTGMMMPTVIQEASIAALSNDNHLLIQKEKYRNRREIILQALLSAGFYIDHSHAGLYLWVTRGINCWQEVDFFAHQGMIVAPGIFYGPVGENHIRIALTITDEQAMQVAQRLTNLKY